ncbi:argininosuccinate lyase [archaeon]|nr:MAG: argininosuccinate lyase [archaeon]
MKTWDKGVLKDDVKKNVLKFLSGRDVVFDQNLVKWDILATIAHEMMLEKIGVLNKKELQQIVKQLVMLYDNGMKLDPELEDVHSNIEAKLIEELGDTGKKVHTAISRNEQVLVDLKLYMKSEIIDVSNRMLKLAKAFTIVAEKYKDSQMPGYTHHQQAMPYTFGSLLMSYFYSLIDDLESLLSAYSVINKNPLGSGAGFGLPIDIDKKFTSDLLGFETAGNSLYHITSRGKNEFVVISSLSQLMLDLNRIAQDFIMFSMKEFGFIELPDAYSTGSSIMPQKKNPDIFEIMKGRTSSVLAGLLQVSMTVKNLPSGYNRDLQEIKGVLMNSVDTAKECLDIVADVIGKVKVNEDKMEKDLDKTTFATHYALSMVKKGMPYKEAYKIAGDAVRSGNDIPKFSTKPDMGNYKPILEKYADIVKKTESEFNSKIEKLISIARNT